MAHFRAISNLSSKLLKALAIYLAITLVFALFDLSGSALGKMSVVCKEKLLMDVYSSFFHVSFYIMFFVLYSF